MRTETRRVAAVAAAAMLVMQTGASAAPARERWAGERWAGAWGYAPANAGDRDTVMPPGTYRYRATLTRQGSAVALTFSNAEGREAVAIASATVGVARDATGTEVDPATVRAVTFAGQADAALPVGRTVLSDAVPVAAAVGRDMVVSVTFSTPTRPARTNLGVPIAFREDGAGAAFRPVQVRPYLSLIAVRGAAAPCTVVAFGDSITDGYLATSPTTRGWPGRLAERMAALPPAKRCGVVNMGVSGNRVLRDGRGVNALDRFWRDVASVPGATHVVLLEGINDIGSGGGNGNPAVTPAMLIEGYRQFAARAHALGLRVIAGTLTPAVRAGYMSAEKDATRKAVNAFVRGGGEGAFDGMIDFDAAVRDPASPDDLRPAFDPGDHLHPNDAGYRAMGDAVDLRLFARGTR